MHVYWCMDQLFLAIYCFDGYIIYGHACVINITVMNLCAMLRESLHIEYVMRGIAIHIHYADLSHIVRVTQLSITFKYFLIM